MGKVIKILAKMVATIILLLIILPLTAALLLTIPSVQKYAVDLTTAIVSNSLGTHVTLERIDLWPIYTANIKGFCVEDHQSDTLLYVGELSTRITNFGSSLLTFGPTKVKGATFNLIEGTDSVLNIKSVLAPIMPEEPKGTFEILFASIDMSESHFSFQKLDKKGNPVGMDYGDIHFGDLCTKIEGLHILGSKVRGRITQLSGTERGGGIVDDMQGTLYVNNGKVTLSDMDVYFGSSHGEFAHLSFIAPSWEEYSSFIERVTIDARLTDGVISLEDVAHFAPNIGDMTLVARDVAAAVSGTVDDMELYVTRLNFAQSSSFMGSVAIKGLPEVRSSYLSIDIESLRSDARDLNIALQGVGVAPLSGHINTILARTGSIGVVGTMRGSLDNLTLGGELKTAVGGVNFDMNLFARPNSGRFMNCRTQSTLLSLGRLLDIEALDKAIFNAEISINNMGIPHEQSIVIDGDFSQLDFNDYPYSALNCSVTIHDNRYSAEVNSLDHNANFSLESDVTLGKVEVGDSTPYNSYNVELDARRIDLHALGLNRRDSISTVRALLSASLSGSSIDELQGRVDIEDIRYLFNVDTLSTDYISAMAYAAPNDRRVNLSSPFIDLEYTSQGSHMEIATYLQGALYRYLPVIYSAEYTPPTIEQMDSSQLTELNVTLHQGELLTRALDPSLSMANGSCLNLWLDPVKDEFALSVNSRYIERGSLLAINMGLEADNSNGELSAKLSSSAAYMGMAVFEELNVTTQVLDNDIALKLSYSDAEDRPLGVIDSYTSLSRGQSGSLDVTLEFAPSYITYDDIRWEISSRELSLRSGALHINDFTIRNAAQYLALNGVAGSSELDLLMVNLHYFDLGMLTQFTESIGYEIEGRTSGFAAINSALGSSRIEASIDMDSVALNNIPSPPLRLSARWDSEMNRAGISVFKREQSDGGAVSLADTLIRGYYRPSNAEYFATINIDSIDIGVIDPLLEGVLSQSSGYASTDLHLSGARQNISLSGEILVEDMSTTVDFTNVTYSLPSAVIHVDNSKFEASRVTIKDIHGGEALMTLRFDISQLSNVNYNVRILPNNLMVLDTCEEQNELFYGRVFASGSATISGDKGGVNMNIAAKSEDNSEFYMPLSSKTSASTAEFITFVEPVEVMDTLSYILSRRASLNKSQRGSGGSNLSISMALELTPGIEVQLVIDPTVGDIIKAKGEGRLNIEMNPQANRFDMYGDYTIAEGNYLFTLQNIVNKRFIIDRGSTIQWSGDPLDAMLNITALYELKTSLQPLLGETSTSETWRSVPVDCIIHLTDRLTQPTVSFAIELPDSDVEQQTMVANILNDQETISRQFFYLMIANSFISESNSNSVASLGSTSTAAATGFELLTNQFSNWLSTSDYSIILRYRPDSELTGDEVDFGFSKGWIDNRLLIEVEGNYVSDYKGSINEVSNIMGEAYVTWLIDKEGALRLRAFSQTIDRFDENQGLQETGVGIYYSENFNNLSDLRRKVVERFSFAARRRQRKAAEQ